MNASGYEQSVLIPAGPVSLQATLHLPPVGGGLVIFSHGSGSGRLSPRNRFVASKLRNLGLGTLLLDLLTEREDSDFERRFDISLLTQRLGAAVHYARNNPRSKAAPIGLFGASTGAASALRVAADMPEDIAAVVSRGGRPDLTGCETLARVRTPTLLIVGGNDAGVIELNERARRAMVNCECEMTVVPGATHLFEESGKLEEVASLAGEWFTRFMQTEPARTQ
jgi:dienelactone hydrolase